MSREYDKSRERSLSSSSKLRMDFNSTSLQSMRCHRESLRKRKELDNVMRKARESQSNYWNKKLLEVEEKDPNRWRHSGYKEMYVGCNVSSGDSKNYTRSPRNRSSRPHSPRLRSPRQRSSSSPKSPRTRSPYTPRARSPRHRNSRSPRYKVAVGRNSHTPRLRSPLSRRSNSPKHRSPKARRSHSLRPRSPKINRERIHNNQHKRFAKSPSSETACSDRSCSMCSPNHRQMSSAVRTNSRSISPTRSQLQTNAATSASSRTTIERTAVLRPSFVRRPCNSPHLSQIPQRQFKECTKLTKDVKLRKKDKHHSKLIGDPRTPDSGQMINKHVKLEKAHTGLVDVSFIHPSADSSPSDDSDSSSVDSHKPSPKMALSERFGKMAQWSIDRRDMENMRITKVENNTMKVVIEGKERITNFGYDSPPSGNYSEPLLTHSSRRLQCWDDIRVRYDYYKSRGYLGDLTLNEYFKWEEWWCRYEEWLEAERYYEQWATQAAPAGAGGRKRRRRNNTTH